MTNLLELINSGMTGVTLNVRLEDLVELLKQTIEAAKAELLPAMVSAAKEVLLTKKGGCVVIMVYGAASVF